MMMSSGAEDSLSSAEEMKAAKANSEVIPNGGENGKHANQEENIQEEEDDEVQQINGGETSNGQSMDEDEEDEEDEDDDEIEEIEDVEPGEADDEETGPSQEVSETDERSNSPQVIGTVPGTAAISSRSPNKRKAPLEMREIEEVVSDDDEDEDEDSDDDVEEVKDDDDSDIMEVEAEDPLKKNQQTPNVVTIDDVKTLQKLAAANSVKSKSGETGDGDKVTLIDTNSILAGKGTSGVTITPAKPKTGLFPEAAKLPSGITISQTSNKSSSNGSNSGGGGASAFGYDQKGQLNDPNLTDDTFVVEAPSFIVPYVYEKPPKEKFEDFSKSVRDLMEKKEAEEKEKKRKEKEERRAKRKEEKKNKRKRKKSGEGGDDDDEDFDEAEAEAGSGEADSSDDDDNSSESEDKKSDQDSDVIELKNNDLVATRRPTSENFFESTLGKFLMDLGMNLVQENVQHDLLRMQVKKSQKDKSASVMHAIMSLKRNIEQSKEHNAPFRLKEIKCRFCSFRTESDLAMQQHLETPHMRQFMYRCNFCPYDTKMPQEVLSHMQIEHGIRGRLERAPGIHQCHQCPFEDNMKGKLTRHLKGCEKRFMPERNQLPPHDWDPPAKIPKPPVMAAARRPPMMGGMSQGNPFSHHTGSHFAGTNRLGPGNPLQQHHLQQKAMYSGMPQLQFGPSRGRGRPIGAYKPDLRLPNSLSMSRAGMSGMYGKGIMGSGSGGGNYLNNQVVLQALNSGGGGAGRFQGNSALSNLTSNSSVTIQSVSSRGGSHRPNNKPSISITPLPGRQTTSLSVSSRGGRPNNNSMRPGQPSGSASASGFAGGAAGGKGSFVICEICDGYIKDLEQLRNHMLWIHKVKIHPKMIYNRPPLNCQKCQFRFFTDQGLERHLLGSHGLVTASMQELANKGQDSGRCPVCGKVYQWKLLNHVSKDHQKTLKPAHLSYKCTVCTATFGQYKLFENHVYQAHSGAAKKQQQQKLMGSNSSKLPGGATIKAPIKMSNEITIIPKPGSKKPGIAQPSSKPKPPQDAEVIELDDEEEIDDVEEGSQAKKSLKRPSDVSAGGPSEKKPRDSEGEDGVEEIEDEEPEDD